MRTSISFFGLLATLALTSGALQAREFGVELQADGNFASHRLPAGTTHVELEQPLPDGCRFNQSWGYDLRTATLWVNGNCAGRFRIYTHDDRSGGSYEGRYGRDPSYAPPQAIVVPAQGGQAIRGQNGLCLDVSGGLKAGNHLIVYRCSGGVNQRFTWTPYGELRAGHLCLDVEGGNQREGTRVVAWECRDQPNQKWSRERGAIRSQYTGLCMDIEGGRGRPEQPVVMWRCSGAPNQRWN